MQQRRFYFQKVSDLVLVRKGGLSRLAFDSLEDQAFNNILKETYDYEYNGRPVAGILLDGNPIDAEVEVWVAVKQKVEG
ncbi:hypothetical protein [Chengkuizengella sediminis]|uniref:hypothetical protein n=1 Tax=Chengkuizengella sediminis TaxID=1885917 RepID=UPI00196A638B|nr:hypothetical protein [Chengkuizengella sediminis]